jgi:enoyl-CoA hydratase/carnithine racemase
VGEIEISERSGGVRVVRLNRPARLNALTPDMVRLITEAMDVGRDHRAIVITGSAGSAPGSTLPARTSGSGDGATLTDSRHRNGSRAWCSPSPEPRFL